MGREPHIKHTLRCVGREASNCGVSYNGNLQSVHSSVNTQPQVCEGRSASLFHWCEPSTTTLNYLFSFQDMCIQVVPIELLTGFDYSGITDCYSIFLCISFLLKTEEGSCAEISSLSSDPSLYEKHLGGSQNLSHVHVHSYSHSPPVIFINWSSTLSFLHGKDLGWSFFSIRTVGRTWFSCLWALTLPYAAAFLIPFSFTSCSLAQTVTTPLKTRLRSYVSDHPGPQSNPREHINHSPV